MANVTKVEYFNGSTLIGTRTSAPFNTFTWVGANTPNGTSPVLSAKIYLDDGSSFTSNSVTITVKSPNTAPSASGDTYIVQENGVLNGNVLDNDTDADGQALTAELVSGPSNGTLTLNSDGSFTYTPNSEYIGSDSFVYKAFDGEDYSANTTVNITVTEQSNPWYELVVTDYKARVEGDFGLLEDEAGLTTALSTMTEADYNSVIAAFNPNGGHRTGKIYDVRDTSLDVNYILDSTQIKVIDSGVSANDSSGWWRGASYISESAEALPSDVEVGEVKKLSFTATDQLVSYMIPVINTANLKKYTVSFWIKQAPTNPAGTLNLQTDNGVNAQTVAIHTFSVSNSWQKISIVVDNKTSDSRYVYNRLNISWGKVVGDFFFAAPQVNEGTTALQYDPTPYKDLTVTGGGGTRIAADGSVEKVEYYNVFPYLPISSWDKTGVTGTETNMEYTITEDTSTGNHWTYYYYGTGYARRTHQVEVKKTDNRYVVVGYGSGGYLIYDFDTNTITANTLPTSRYADDIEVKSDGWVRISFYVDYQTTSATRHVLVGLSLDGTSVSYAGTGKSVKFRKPQVVEHLDNVRTIKVLPYQLNTGSAAFPKIDYSTGKAAFLIEPTRTNRIPYSNDFTHSNWVKRDGITITANYGISPEGIQNASLMQSSSNVADLYYNTSSVAGAVNVMSIWIKSLSGDKQITITSVAGSGVSETYTVGSEWQRIHVSILDYGGVYLPNIPIGDYLIYGAQHETGSLTTYIPTNGSAVTRLKNYYQGDVSLTEGGVFIHFTHKSYGDTENRYLFILYQDGNFVPTRNAILINNNSLGYIIENNVSTNVKTLVEGQEYKVFLRIQSGALKVFINGVQEGSNTSSVTATKNKFIVGNYDSSFPDNRHIYSTIHDIQLTGIKTDQEAIDLTTL